MFKHISYLVYKLSMSDETISYRVHEYLTNTRPYKC